MIKVILPKYIEGQLELALKNAGQTEIGGIIMGEYVSKNVFKICEITIDYQQGTINNFVRKISNNVQLALHKFFQRSKFNYKRYNYMGEWHSHPSFALKPSSKDIQSMFDMLHTELLDANFLILLILKYDEESVNGSVFLFVPGNIMLEGKLIREDDDC